MSVQLCISLARSALRTCEAERHQTRQQLPSPACARATASMKGSSSAPSHAGRRLQTAKQDAKTVAQGNARQWYGTMADRVEIEQIALLLCLAGARNPAVRLKQSFAGKYFGRSALATRLQYAKPSYALKRRAIPTRTDTIDTGA
eukprot:1901510-Pleurochrysis_carterae.AAC.4